MYKGLLVYSKIRSYKNEWFINHLIQVAKNYDIFLDFIFDIDINLKEIKNNNYSFIIYRSDDLNIKKHLQNLNILMINSLEISKLANNKYNTYKVCRKLNIPCLKTTLLNTKNIKTITYPKVIKEVSGHGGNEVFLVRNNEELHDILKNSITNNKLYISQDECDTPGIDIRVYVINNEVIKVVKRYSRSDFRANYSLGGNFVFSKLNEEIKNILNILFSNYKFGFVGIDFIINNKKYILNEIEDIVGCRMLYLKWDKDIADILFKEISKILKHK